jgi:hypothetical protein
VPLGQEDHQRAEEDETETCAEVGVVHAGGQHADEQQPRRGQEWSLAAETNKRGPWFGAGRPWRSGTREGRLDGVNRPVLPAVLTVLTAGLLLFPLQVATAQSAVPPSAPSAEAWYRTTAAPAAPACTLPVGCPPAPLPSQYPPGTLHVGVTAGQEEARTYLAFDLSGLTGELTGGTLTLPVASGAGSRAPETAKLRACLVTAPVQDGVDGEVQPAPPAVDCATSADAVYAAGDGQGPAVFTVDLAAFATAFGSGAAALSLVPAEGVPPTDNWHVALSRRDRQAEVAVPISATFQVAAAESPPPAQEETAAPSFGFTPPVDSFAPSTPFDVPSFGGTSFAAPPLTESADQPLDAPVAPEVAAPQIGSVPVASVLAGPFAYPAVFLLPLLFAVGVGWAGRAFTRDLLPA